jgi:hypothetical protein
MENQFPFESQPEHPYQKEDGCQDKHYGDNPMLYDGSGRQHHNNNPCCSDPDKAEIPDLSLIKQTGYNR